MTVYLSDVKHHHHEEKTGSQKQLLSAFVLNSVFVVIELIGGVLTNSVAIISDALHDLGDSFALGAAWYFERLSGKGRTAGHTYGYRRYSVLGAVLNAMVLIAGSVLVIREAVIRLSAPEPVHSEGMIALAVLGILVNGLAFSRIHTGHSHNVEVVRLHLLEDVLGWIAVLFGAIAIQLWDVYILDPLLSLLVSTWILFQVIRRLIQSLRIILQLAPSGLNTVHIDKMIRSLAGVSTTHDTHIWTMDGSYHVLTIHVVVNEDRSLAQLGKLKSEIRRLLKAEHIGHATIEFEYPDEDCGYEDC